MKASKKEEAWPYRTINNIQIIHLELFGRVVFGDALAVEHEPVGVGRSCGGASIKKVCAAARKREATYFP